MSSKEHREKRERAVDAELAARKASKHAEAEHNLEQQSRRVMHERNEADWMGVGSAADTLRVTAEEGAVDLEEHQYRNAEAARERDEDRQRYNQRIWRRQNRLANQRRNVRNELVQRLGREPTMDEFIAAVAQLRDDYHTEEE